MKEDPHLTQNSTAVDDMDVSPSHMKSWSGEDGVPFILRIYLSPSIQVPEIAIKVDFMGGMTGDKNQKF